MEKHNKINSNYLCRRIEKLENQTELHVITQSLESVPLTLGQIRHNTFNRLPLSLPNFTLSSFIVSLINSLFVYKDSNLFDAYSGSTGRPKELCSVSTRYNITQTINFPLLDLSLSFEPDICSVVAFHSILEFVVGRRGKCFSFHNY